MRKAKTFYATRGALTASGANKTEAKANLEPMIDWACNAGMPVIECRFGFLIVVASDANGWSTSVVGPDDMVHGQRKWCGTSHGQQIAYSDALISARNHAAQNAWSPDVADDAAFVEMAGLGPKSGELASWIAFQRRYVEAKTSGHNDGDAFKLAIGLPIAA